MAKYSNCWVRVFVFTIMPGAFVGAAIYFKKDLLYLVVMGYNARNDEIRDNITRMRRGSTTRCTGYSAPLQCNTFGQGLCLVLAQDCCRAHIKTSLVDYCLRQLRDRG